MRANKQGDAKHNHLSVLWGRNEGEDGNQRWNVGGRVGGWGKAREMETPEKRGMWEKPQFQEIKPNHLRRKHPTQNDENVVFNCHAFG